MLNLLCSSIVKQRLIENCSLLFFSFAVCITKWMMLHKNDKAGYSHRLRVFFYFLSIVTTGRLAKTRKYDLIELVFLSSPSLAALLAQTINAEPLFCKK